MLSRLSIKQKLILIMLIPLIVVILLAAKLAVDSFSSSKNLQSLDKVVVLSIKIGNLVHETQKEKLKYLLQLADMVKFAKVEPIAPENEQSIANAYDFINSTIPQVTSKEETVVGKEEKS